ncbi:hypothetical protein F2Q70_00009808 [Brassica cretica]|uniref:Uncharacterized protein n=1 Tax=Brassica cretica TaxID=69181 RepID=A0A8S9MA11_BRACR|nr:hypothetical protein F2Q70_00009808 [Brassica cretica]
MTVAQLVQQPGREHLLYLTPCPKGRCQTWFNRSGNGISAWINNMMYSNLSKGYPTFTHFPGEDQEMWFRLFASSPEIPITRTLSVTPSSIKLWTTMGSRSTSGSRSGSSTRIFMAEKRFEYRYATEEELEKLKQRKFSGWMLTYGFCFLGKASEYSEEIPRKSKRSSEFPRNTRK